MYMNYEDILWVKENIKYLTYYTTFNNCISILKDGLLKIGSGFEVTNPPHAKLHGPRLFRTNGELYKYMASNFNISMCDYSPILLFDPKILWKLLCYYFSYHDSYGQKLDSIQI